MIPTIGIMVGGYIILRCVDVLCRPDNSFSSRSGMLTVQILAVVVIMATLLEIAALLLSGESIPRALTP